MIKYKLQCEKNHEFTSWFANSSEFERLKKEENVRVYLLQFQRYKKINYVSKSN